MNTIDSLGDIRFEANARPQDRHFHFSQPIPIFTQHFIILKASSVDHATLAAAPVIASGDSGSRADALTVAKTHAPCVLAFEAGLGTRTYDDFILIESPTHN